MDIVWVSHDADVFGLGDLQVGFNSRYPGGWYRNGGFFNSDVGLGPVTDQWVTVYANDTLVVRYKPHTYVAKGYVPFNGSMEILAGPASSPTPPIPENPNAFVREYNGGGIATHLGAMQVWMKLTIYPDQVYPYTDPLGYDGWAMPYSGNALLTAANGDTINCQVAGIEALTVQPWWVEGSLSITGVPAGFKAPKVT